MELGRLMKLGYCFHEVFKSERTFKNRVFFGGHVKHSFSIIMLTKERQASSNTFFALKDRFNVGLKMNIFEVVRYYITKLEYGIQKIHIRNEFDHLFYKNSELVLISLSMFNLDIFCSKM